MLLCCVVLCCFVCCLLCSSSITTTLYDFKCVCIYQPLSPCYIYREYGDGWHKSGMLDKKQNVFDDFIAAGDYLVQNNYTNPSRLYYDVDL